jgi:DNA helicase-2/ATP-dependent DNA helicase PcrA
VDEERRVFYVGMTRAREYLYLARAIKRPLFGQVLNNPPSRFLADIQEDLKAYEQIQQRTRREMKKEDDSQLTLF